MPNSAIAEPTMKDLREAAGLTQDEFGDAVGLTGSSVSQLETGARLPHPNTAKKIADKLSDLHNMEVRIWDLWPARFKNPKAAASNQPTAPVATGGGK